MVDEMPLADKCLHVLMFCYPGQGHISPFMYLARTLASKGVIITFANTEYCISRMSANFKTNRIDPSLGEKGLDIRLVGLPDGLPDNNPRDVNDIEVLNAYLNMVGVFEDLLRRLLKEKPSVSCIIMDPFLSFSREVANKFKLPLVLFWTATASVFSIHWHTDLIIEKEVLPITVSNGLPDDTKRFIDGIPGVPPISPEYLPSSILLGTSDSQFQYFYRQFKHIHEADWILINSFKELESLALEALQTKAQHILDVGPLLPRAFVEGNWAGRSEIGASLWIEDNKCLQWLDNQKNFSVLYISFGSARKLQVDLFQEFARGLLASKQPFLWVVRSDLVENSNPSRFFHEEFRRNTQHQGHIVTWTNQLGVLSHPAIGGFLTHCGWNSVVESVCAGVPMIGWPQAHDQITTSKLVLEDLEIGMVLKAGDTLSFTRNVEDVIRVVMQGGEGKAMRSNACHLRNAARNAVAPEGSSSRNIEMFVQDMVRRKQAASSEQDSIDGI